MLSILHRCALRDHLLVYLQTRPSACFLIRAKCSSQCWITGLLGLPTTTKKTTTKNVFHSLLVWLGGTSEINHIKVFQKLRRATQMHWIITLMTPRNSWSLAPWRMVFQGLVFMMTCVQKALTFGSMTYWLCTRGQVWQPQVVHFMYIYLV